MSESDVFTVLMKLKIIEMLADSLLMYLRGLEQYTQESKLNELGYYSTTELGKIENVQSDISVAEGHTKTVLHCIRQAIQKLEHHQDPSKPTPWRLSA